MNFLGGFAQSFLPAYQQAGRDFQASKDDDLRRQLLQFQLTSAKSEEARKAAAADQERNKTLGALAQEAGQIVKAQNAIDAAGASGQLTPDQITALSLLAPQDRGQAFLDLTGALAPALTEEQQLGLDLTRADIGLKQAQADKAMRPPAAPETYKTVLGKDLGLPGELADKLYSVNQATGQTTQVGGGGVTVNTGEGSIKVPSGFMLGPDKASVLPIPGGPQDPTLPQNKTEAQLKSAGFADRAEAAHAILGDLGQPGGGETTRTGIAELVGGALDRLSPTAGDAVESMIQSEGGQQRSQAERDFVTAVLRKESGAVIADDEFERERKKFFPTSGDGQKVIEQKRQARQRAIDNLRRESAPGGEAKQPEVIPVTQASTADLLKELGL
ncbi:MAG: hypothetical protein R3F54_28695 [Alphaproteobacteria bacterium]